MLSQFRDRADRGGVDNEGMRKTLAVMLVLGIALPAAGFKRRAVRVSPPGPSGCRVTGLKNFHYSADGGATWSINAEAPAATGSWDLAVFADEPDVLLTVVGRDVTQSNDAGCTWAKRYSITEDIHHKIQIARGPARRAFIWTEEWALRYDDGDVVRVDIPERIGAVGIDPGNREHVRILGVETGNAYESFDGGRSWQSTGGSAGGFVNSFVFDPTDFSRVVAGIQTKGLFVSRDGGKSWSDGAPSTRAVCHLSIVPNQPAVIWATIVSQGTEPTIYRSTDAGATLTPIGRVEGVPEGVCLPILANPHDPNEAIVPFQQFHQADAVMKSVTPWTCCGARMNRIAWSPADPSRVYVQTVTP